VLHLVDKEEFTESFRSVMLTELDKSSVLWYHWFIIGALYLLPVQREIRWKGVHRNGIEKASGWY
jgi:hypothetical protein